MESLQAQAEAVLATIDEQHSPEPSKYARLRLSDVELMLRLAAEGVPQAKIAEALECSQSTVSATLSRLKQTPEVVQALMKGEATNMLRQWKRATRVAAKRGDHRPAREWIEAAHPELRPAHGHAGGVGVTIVIGQPGQPVDLPVIDALPVPPETDDAA